VISIHVEIVDWCYHDWKIYINGSNWK
jgi:hypothetical protein